MPLSTADCKRFNNHMFTRTPNFQKELQRDRFPRNNTYNGLYPTDSWANGKSAEQFWDQVHVTAVNDNGCWDAVNTDPCVGAPCDPPRGQVGWGSTRRSFGRFRRVYETQPFCFEQLRDLTAAAEQVASIYNGLKQVPDDVMSNYMRLWSIRSADQLYIAGSADLRIDVTDDMFTNQCMRLNLGSADNLPTSKLTMEYLNHQTPELLANGYFDQEYDTGGNFTIFADMQTQTQLSNANPALRSMYNAADFTKGGKYFAHGVMNQVGNWLFKLDTEQIRFQHLGNGVLERVMPYENVAATVGKKKVFSQAYLNAPYAAFHAYNPAARIVYHPDASPIGSNMSFKDKLYNGSWQWMNPDVIIYQDPITGVQCTLRNDFHNQGYWAGWYELGVKTLFPEIERVIIAQIENQVVVNDARCTAEPATATQSLLPYNAMCGTPGGDLDLDPGALP